MPAAGAPHDHGLLPESGEVKCTERSVDTPADSCHTFLMSTTGNLIQHTTELAMYLVRAYVRPGDAVIDATCGNGHDTLQLAGMRPGHLYAFDVQQAAILATGARLEQAGFDPGSVTLLRLGHENMAAYFQEHPCRGMQEGFARAIVFNLGYLPGGDKRITTGAGTTLEAVRGALSLLMPEGLLCITMYSGHPEGAEEKRALLALAEELDGKLWHVSYISMPNQKKAPPEILLITRK